MTMSTDTVTGSLNKWDALRSTRTICYNPFLFCVFMYSSQAVSKFGNAMFISTATILVTYMLQAGLLVRKNVRQRTAIYELTTKKAMLNTSSS